VAHALSFGLVHLLAILNADTYDKRYRLLGGETPKRNHTFLPHGFSSGAEFSRAILTEQDKEDVARQFPPFVEESDTGPPDAWRWAYQGDKGHYLSYSEYQIPLLQRGYCMWDSARLDEWRIFAHPWHPPEPPRDTLSHDFPRRKFMEHSWRARLLIYEDGGRGWWSLGDESEIVWPPGGEAKYKERMKGKPWWGLDLGEKARKNKEWREAGWRLLQREMSLRDS
jgi:hypothetical protein